MLGFLAGYVFAKYDNYIPNNILVDRLKTYALTIPQQFENFITSKENNKNRNYPITNIVIFSAQTFIIYVLYKSIKTYILKDEEDDERSSE